MLGAESAAIFAALGDPFRLSLLLTLSREGPHSIARLAADTRISRQAVTKHLHVLERVGLVRSDRSGRESRYVCEPQPLAAARDCLDEISAQWDDVLGRLKLHVEED